jgi:tetratricopeptide (TPR) repeat protein
MKAQRRHELQENELAKIIKGAPTFWQQSGGKLLLACIAALVIAILIRYRMSSSREAVAKAQEALATARNSVAEMQQIAAMSQFSSAPQALDSRRKQAYNEANSAISDAMRTSDDRQVEAEALIARGDLNWIAATMPELPGAATQPTLKFRDQKELLNTAAEAYETVVNSYPDLVHARIAARFGLAAIAENRGQWDVAKSQYEKIAIEAKDIGAYQTLAAQRLALVPLISQPVMFGKPTTLPSPTTLPTGTLPTTFVAPPAAATTRAAATAPATTTTTPASQPK